MFPGSTPLAPDPTLEEEVEEIYEMLEECFCTMRHVLQMLLDLADEVRVS